MKLLLGLAIVASGVLSACAALYVEGHSWNCRTDTGRILLRNADGVPEYHSRVTKRCSKVL